MAKKNTVSLILASIVLLALFSTISFAQASRDYVYIVGSSTVYPFSTVVAERFGVERVVSEHEELYRKILLCPV